jgi:hypothetical protein
MGDPDQTVSLGSTFRNLRTEKCDRDIFPSPSKPPKRHLLSLREAPMFKLKPGGVLEDPPDLPSGDHDSKFGNCPQTSSVAR